MKLNLDLPIIRYDGKPAVFPNGDTEKLGETLSLVVANGKVEDNRIHWASKTCKTLAACGTVELGSSELGEIVKMIPLAPIATWCKGPILFLLGEKVEDAEALSNYHSWYGEEPHIEKPNLKLVE